MYDFPREPAWNVYTNKTFIHNLHDYCKYTYQWKLCGNGMLWLLSCLNDVWHIPEITSAYLWFLSFSWSGLSPHDNINDIRSILISHIFNRHKHIKTYLSFEFDSNGLCFRSFFGIPFFLLHCGSHTQPLPDSITLCTQTQEWDNAGKWHYFHKSS